MSKCEPLRRVTEEKQLEYLENPNHCPGCGAPIRKVGRFKRPKRRVSANGEGLKIRFDMQCGKCRTKYTEIYALVAIVARQGRRK